MPTRAVKISQIIALTFTFLITTIACNSGEFSSQSSSKKNSKDLPTNKAERTSSCKKKSNKIKSPATLTLNGDIGSCQLKANGNQARYGVYGVVLTNPAPCDFKMPYITVATSPLLALDSKRIPIGTYWDSIMSGSSHPFELTVESTGMPILDNGILLIQPDGKSYLIVDAGMAKPHMPGYQTAKEVANQISESLGFGSTELLKPQAGSPSDRYASSTIFKAGSVLAIYDDTPDMAGTIAVDLLIADAVGINEVGNISEDLSIPKNNPADPQTLNTHPKADKKIQDFDELSSPQSESDQSKDSEC